MQHINILMKYDKLLHTLHLCGLFTAIWPLDSKAGKFKIFSYNVLWFIYTLNTIILYYLITKSILPAYQKDFIDTIKTLVELIYNTEVIFNFFYCRVRRKRLQVRIPIRIYIDLQYMRCIVVCDFAEIVVRDRAT